jgi:hypothetical protein
MNTSNYRTASFETLPQKGWMLDMGSAYHLSRQQQKINYPKTASSSGWMQSTGSARRLNKRHRPPALSNTSEAIALHPQWLNAHQVDVLADDDLDWISLLPGEWPLEVFNISLPGVENFQSQWHQRSQSVETLVQLTQQAPYYPVSVGGEICWSYTCCLQVPKLGRVRFFVYFRDSARREKYAAFITNRLDWSPHKVISQCLERSCWNSLLGLSLV